jgi:hypothetical protein
VNRPGIAGRVRAREYLADDDPAEGFDLADVGEAALEVEL